MRRLIAKIKIGTKLCNSLLILIILFFTLEVFTTVTSIENNTENIEVSLINGIANNGVANNGREIIIDKNHAISVPVSWNVKNINDELGQMKQTIIIFNLIFVIITIIQAVINYDNSEKEERLEEKAYIDIHTGLPNKSKCHEMIKGVNFSNSKSAVIMFDLNYLKKVNDTLGHVAGDTLIQNFANLLREELPQNYFIGRFGGDEFIAIVNGVEESQIESDLIRLSEKIHKFNEFSYQIPISYAYGYAVSLNEGECLQTLLKRADENMYICKKEMHKDLTE